MKFTKRRFYHEPDRNYRLQAWNDLCHNGNSAHDSCHMYSCTIIYPDWAGTDFTDKLAIYISLYLLGWKRGTISYLIYLLIGLVGIPVFSGFTGGPAKLAGPTGGYIIGFIAMAIIAGLVIDHFHQPWLQLIGMIVELSYAMCSVQHGSALRQKAQSAVRSQYVCSHLSRAT